VGGNINYPQATYSLQKSQNTSLFNKRVNKDVFYELPLGFIFTSELIYNHNSGRTAVFNQTDILWNTSIARQFFKNKQRELKPSVFDLLKQNRSIVRNVSDMYMEDVRSQVLRL
jgi:hypothetical protein